MRITKISLQGFRAFDEPFVLDLDGGKNLLLHGENGSGKSSIYFALKRFFEERGDDVLRHRNQFSAATRSSQVSIHFKRTDAAGIEHVHECHWDNANGHPLPVPDDAAASPVSEELRRLLLDGARRAGFVDYRAMLRTHFRPTSLRRERGGPLLHDVIYGEDSVGLEKQLFDLVSLVVLGGVRVPVQGQGERTIGELMRAVWRWRPPSRHRRFIDRANLHTTAFNHAFNQKLTELATRLAEFLRYFENHQLEITFQPVALAWHPQTVNLEGAELVPQVKFRGTEVQNYQQFLNEARLSAISTCMFLAGVLLADVDPQNANLPRFLVLDDALIGLDLQNRLPILKILQSPAFSKFQILLFTHDRVWFELAKGHLREDWLHTELLADETTGSLIPREMSSKDDVERARVHLRAGDLKAAAVYARSAFEWRLRNVCEKHGIKIPFRPDADKVGAGLLWDGIVLDQRKREEERGLGSVVHDFIDGALEVDVETMRSTVLNKLSHTGASSLVAAEVAAAIATVERVIVAPFRKRT